MAADFSDFLTDNEKAVLKHRPQIERTIALANVAELGVLLQDLETAVEAVRTSKDIETVTRLGNLALQITRQLRELGITEPVGARPAPEQAVSLPDAPASDELPTPAEVEIVDTEARAVAGLDPKVEEWFVAHGGENWLARLGLPPATSLEVIADKLVGLTAIRHPNTRERSLQCIMAYLRGENATAISKQGDLGSTGAIQQYIHKVRRGFKARYAPQGTPVAEVIETEVPVVEEEVEELPAPEPLRPEPVSIQPTRVREVTERIPEIVVPPAPVERAIEEEPLHVQLTHRIKEVARLQGAEVAGLQSFLDPKSRGDMTPAKLAAIDKVRKVIRDKIDDPAFDLSPAEMQWVRRSLGVYTFAGTPRDRDPMPVVELTRSARQPGQKDDIPTFIYEGLEKLFAEKTGASRQIDSLVQAAIDPASLDETQFKLRRDELLAELADTGELSAEEVAAIKIRSRFGAKDEHRAVNDAVKTALRRFEQRIVKQGGVNSGNPLIDLIFKKFSSSNYMAGHLDALRAELPPELQRDPSTVERIVAAGIKSIYRRKAEEAA